LDIGGVGHGGKGKADAGGGSGDDYTFICSSLEQELTWHETASIKLKDSKCVL